VNATGTPERNRLRWFQRVGLAVAAAALVSLLVTARTLTPDEHGHGTHQQLGLPPCTFYMIFGRPCPACGMTTSWAWLLRGNVIQAAEANAGGAMLAMLSIVAAPWMLISAIRGRWLLGLPSDWTFAALALTISAVTAGQWIWRMTR
jgi:hypothetical protein